MDHNINRIHLHDLSTKLKISSEARTLELLRSVAAFWRSFGEESTVATGHNGPPQSPMESRKGKGGVQDMKAQEDERVMRVFVGMSEVAVHSNCNYIITVSHKYTVCFGILKIYHHSSNLLIHSRVDKVLRGHSCLKCVWRVTHCLRCLKPNIIQCDNVPDKILETTLCSPAGTLLRKKKENSKGLELRLCPVPVKHLNLNQHVRSNVGWNQESNEFAPNRMTHILQPTCNWTYSYT